MNAMKLFAPFCMALLLVIGCNLAVGTLAERNTLTEDPPVYISGAQVSIPMISSALLSKMNASFVPPSGGISSQAILFSTSARFDLYQGETLIQTWQLSDNDGLTRIGADGPPRLEGFFPIDAGENYTLEVEVFNSHVSVSVPVVHGVSEPFDVLAGASTPVTIIAVPAAPIEFSADGATSTLSIVQTPFFFVYPPQPNGGDDVVFTGIGGEAWFDLDVTGGGPNRFVRILADPGSGADAIFLMYEPDGSLMEGSNDPPAWSWGFLPDQIGGRGGTRAAAMGAVPDAFRALFGMILTNRTGAQSSVPVTVRMDFLDRPYVAYLNTNIEGSGPPEPEGFELLPPHPTTLTQTIFRSGGEDDGERLVHWVLFDGIAWEHPNLMEKLPITVTITFDVLDPQHLVGFEAWEDNGDLTVKNEMLVLLVGNPEGEDDPTLYRPLMDEDFAVVQHPDGTTTLTFTIAVDTEGATAAGLAISSRYSGNQFTVSWSAPGEIHVGVE